MKRVVFIVEGDTELSFIHNCVMPYLYQKGITQSMNAQKITTNRKLNKRGGNISFEYLKNDISHLAATGNVLITTLVDFFKLPNNFPNYTTDSSKIHEIENEMRDALQAIIAPENFLPYIQRHEIESLMYTSMEGFNFVVDDEKALSALQEILNQYPNPEDINGGTETAPSKRLMKIFPYQKTTDGEMIFEELKIDDIRAKCPRFNDWMNKLEEGLKRDSFLK